MPRHLAFPLVLNADGQLASNEQDSDADLAASVEIVLVYPQGTRPGKPAFGIDPEMIFDQQPLEMGPITAAVSRCEPAVEVSAEREGNELVRAGVENIRLRYGSAV